MITIQRTRCRFGLGQQLADTTFVQSGDLRRTISASPRVTRHDRRSHEKNVTLAPNLRANSTARPYDWPNERKHDVKSFGLLEEISDIPPNRGI